MNYKLKKDIVIKAGTIFKGDNELPEDVILDLEIEDKEGLLLGTVFVNIPEEFKDNWESWLEPESVNSDKHQENTAKALENVAKALENIAKALEIDKVKTPKKKTD